MSFEHLGHNIARLNLEPTTDRIPEIVESPLQFFLRCRSWYSKSNPVMPRVGQASRLDSTHHYSFNNADGFSDDIEHAQGRSVQTV